ncbi:hypothetical protein CVT25_002307 [Psilocybe cyanescens]|uniref:Major facilitator superfamily (MFS) profile domain-containing protein n=1 Tax=Psilocybe cyanescens TaxID=93625 RepID=A0A409WKR5_PSICY|nr:hypothetical protein CVT25_002307 [Psilocybe cyanescens]
MNKVLKGIENVTKEYTQENHNTNPERLSEPNTERPPLDLEISDAGRVAWLTVAGAYLYSFGVYQDYYTRIFLSNDSASRIAWIGSIQLAMPFVIGLWSGKLFDNGHFHVLEILGGILFTISLFMLSLTQPGKYYQVFLSQGIGMGFGLGLTFVPTFGVLNHHFRRRKALVTGIALTGTSMGAVVFPISKSFHCEPLVISEILTRDNYKVLNHLITSIGFGKAVRASAYVVLGCLVLGNCLMRTAYTKIAIINGASSLGRITANYLADVYGPFNVFLTVMVCTAATIFSVLGVKTPATLVVVSILYGFFSGAWLSVSMAALASLSRSPQEVGARIGLALALSSVGSLVSTPIQGALLGNNFHWNRPAIFSGVCPPCNEVAC